MQSKEVIFDAGEHIRSAINHLLERAKYEKKWNRNVFGMFNGIKLTVKDNDTADSIYSDYQKQRNIQEQQYQKSNKEEIENKAIKVKLMQSELDKLTDELINNDLTQQEIVDLFIKIQPLSDHTDVKINKEILTKLKKLGYYANMNLTSSPLIFDQQTLDFKQKYLIGQVIDNINRVGAIHYVYIKFYNDIHKK